MDQVEQKELSHYLAECLKALGQTDGAASKRIKEIHRYVVSLWGGAVPSEERMVAGFVSNRPQTTQPQDLWFFSQNRCVVAKSFLLEKLELQLLPLRAGITKLRVTRHQVGPEGTTAVTLAFDDGTEERLEAAGENCAALETLLREVLIPKLRC